MTMRDRFLVTGVYVLVAAGFYWLSGVVAQRKLEAVFAEGRAQYIAEQKNPTPIRPRPAVASIAK